MVEASFTGVVRTVLIVVGVIVILRFINQLFTAKRGQAEAADLERKRQHFEKAKKEVEKNKGKVRILGKKEHSRDESDYVDYEEVKD